MPSAAFKRPAAIMVMASTPMKTEFPDAGTLLKAKELPSLTLALYITRAQFSDLLRLLAGRLKECHFTLEETADGSWPVHKSAHLIEKNSGHAPDRHRVRDEETQAGMIVVAG
jgi:hypothetical protein